MSLSFAEVASLWKTEKSKYIKRSSYAVYVLYLNKHLLPWFGPGNVPNSKTVQGFVDECLSKGKTKNTIRGYLLVLNMVLQYGESLGEWHYQKYHVHYPAFERSHKLQVFTVPQQQLLIKYLIDNISFRNLGIIICLNSGLRIGEICGLQWRDLDLATGEIHVRKTVQRIFLSDGEDKEYALSIDTPKTKSSARDIPMSRDLIKLVRPLKTLTHEDYYVISNSQTPLEPRYYRNYLRKVLGILGLPQLGFHSLRHSFATRCIESKCDYKTVSAILGHASLATTMDLYVHPGYDDKKKVVETMARALKL